MSFFYFFLLLFSFLPLYLFANREIVYRPLRDDFVEKIRLTIHTKYFIDNTEYFNKIMEGKTIFGFHLLPSLTFVMAEHMALNIGLLWHKNFGQLKPWRDIRPLCATFYKKKYQTFVIGIFSLQEYPPMLLEPLLDPHQLFHKPFIEGFHFKLGNNKSYLAGWLDWVTLLSKKRGRPERFTIHLDGSYHGIKLNKTVDCKIIFQLAMYHLGGQGISVKAHSLFCNATGFALHFILPNSCFNQINYSSYLLLHRYVKEIDRPFKKGWGQLHTIDFDMLFMGLTLSYWHGVNFSSENMGYPLYQSIRIEDHKVVHHERIRSLLCVSLYKTWMPYSGIAIQVVARPYYDFKNQLLEYGVSCQLCYAGKFNLPTLPYINGDADIR